MSDAPTIAVLGGGNGAHALAAGAALDGLRVRMYEDPAFAEAFEAVRRSREIELTAPDRRGVARLERATHDLGEAVDGAALLNVVTSTAGHAPLFARLAPLLRPGHVVVVWAGRFGGLRLARRLRDAGRAEGVVIAETNTLPFGTRLAAPGRVTVFYGARRIFVGAQPAARAADVVEALRRFCPVAQPVRDILSAAFRNSALVVYPAGALFNAGRVEHAHGEFFMFREGITPAVARVIRALYAELARVGDALGLDVEHYPETAFAPPHTIEKEEFTDEVAGAAALDNLKGPTSIPSRYLYENLRDALGVVAELGQVASVPTPGIDAMIRLGGLLTGEDFWAERQGLASLGLEGLDAGEIRAAIGIT